MPLFLGIWPGPIFHAPNNLANAFQRLQSTFLLMEVGLKSDHFQGHLGITQVQNLELFHLIAHDIILEDTAQASLFMPQIIKLANAFSRLQSTFLLMEVGLKSG